MMKSNQGLFLSEWSKDCNDIKVAGLSLKFAFTQIGRLPTIGLQVTRRARMLSITKINPMARAVGTMGAVAALVGGITFANLQSNAVALSPNNLTSATATLAIGDADTCPEGDTTTVPGLTATLVPGVPSSARSFCLDNKSGIPMNITTQIPTDLTSSPIPANQVSLKITCDGVGTLEGTLDQYASPVALGALGANSQANCSETATLNASYNDNTGKSVTPFDVQFVGNQQNS
jgi:hypothetical protein